MKKFLLLIALFAGIIPAYANKVAITNVSIINNGPGAISVQFDLSWDKGWRTNVGPANYDGVWVFFKYRTPGGTWQHLNLTGNNNVLPAGLLAFQNGGTNKTGAIIYRDATNLGVGTITATGIVLGAINTLPYNIDVKAFAIEMVYIPAPTNARPVFGDGDGINESAFAFHYTDNLATNNSVLPLLVDAAGNGFDDAELKTDGIYVYSNDTIQTTNPIGALEAFPTMKAMWCMKHEINQAAYRDFLNTLTYDQQATRTSVAPNSVAGTLALGTLATRNGIAIATPGVSPGTPAVFGCNLDGDAIYNETTDGEWIACNFLAWVDVAAYLDWSGLAPMSELQFERMCRGNTSAGANAAVLGEYAWGTNTIDSIAYTLTNPGTASELASNASGSVGNAVYALTSTGPVRSGMFATANSTRITSGASFYGVMELSGSVTEYCIMLGCVAGRSCHFIPNGNGVLSPAGNAQLSVGGAGFWPGMEGNLNLAATTTCSGTCEVTSSGGIMIRGGSLGDPKVALGASYRGTQFTPTARASNRGGRGVLYIR